MKCYAYKEDGTICGAPATHLCRARGTAVCAEHILPEERGKSANELATDIQRWQDTSQDYFTIRLFKLIAKADIRNLERLRAGFPNEVAAYEAWQRYGDTFLEDPEKFIFKGTMREFFDGAVKRAEENRK